MESAWNVGALLQCEVPITAISSLEWNQDLSRAKRGKDGLVFITDRGRPAHVL